MDIKSNELKVSNPQNGRRAFAAWLCLIFGISILAGGLLILPPIGSDLFYDGSRENFYETRNFTSWISSEIYNIIGKMDAFDKTLTSQKESDIATDFDISDFDIERYGSMYYANPNNHRIYCTGSETTLDDFVSSAIYRSNENRGGNAKTSLLYYSTQSKEEKLVINGTVYDFENDPDGIFVDFRNMLWAHIGNKLDNITVAFSIEFEMNDTNSFYYNWNKDRMALLIYVILMTIAIVLIVFGIVFRKYRKQFIKRLMKLTGWFLTEIKIAALIVATLWVYTFLNIGVYYYNIIDTIVFSIITIFTFWLIFYLVMDLICNRKTLLEKTMAYKVNLVIKKFARGKPFQKLMLIRLIALLATEFLLAFWTVTAISSYARGAGLFFAALGIILAVLFTIEYSKGLRDFSKIIDHIKIIHDGDMKTEILLPPTSDLYDTAINLNDLQGGVNRAVAANMRSERMKIELITNVSHDLKTPLTSIISYADLLASLELKPDEANDYVKIVKQKAERLNKLTNDLFDISKAQSGDMIMNIERIDMTAHLNQTLAELEERINSSNLEFKINIPEESLFILADGAKLYRIFENLIVNAIKYALPSTRVYVILSRVGNKAVFEIKNIASYEMDFNTEYITERFTRADLSRTEEGSGLGLAICKLFTRNSGGEFSINIDGDLFKAKVEFAIDEAAPNNEI